MVELEYNGERYMVDGGKWYRRLNEREVRPPEYEYLSDVRIPKEWYKGEPYLVGVALEDEENPDDYRVPCVDPRPPFKVGDMVKVARKDEGWAWWESCMEVYIGVETPVISVDRDGDVEIDIEHEGEWVFPPWCLDLIKPAKPTVGQTIIERLTKHVEKTEQETAKVMKFSQWQLRPVKEPKTLADVESSREKPVLCWWNDHAILPCYVNDHGLVKGIVRTGGEILGSMPVDHDLYQPPAPAYTLDTLPDYRVVYTAETDHFYECLWFRENSKWFCSNDGTLGSFKPSASEPTKDWRLTNLSAEFVGGTFDLTGGAK